MSDTDRVFALDNIRTLMVLFIVLLHAACAYAASIPWWHAQDAKHPLFDLTLFTIDNFALPTLFFVAGVFAHPSLSRHGLAQFVKGKLRRLGLPTLVLSTFYLPTMVYMGYLRRAEAPASFTEYWLHWMSTLTDWNFALFTSMETAAKYQDAYSPHHFWFIVMLLLFFLAYAAFHALFSNVKTRFTPIQSLCLIALAMFVSFTTINLMLQDWAWARLGPLLLFQPTRLPIYLGTFLLGIACSTPVRTEHRMPGKTWLWAILFIVGQLAILMLSTTIMGLPSTPPLHLAALVGILRTVITLSAICLCINLGYALLSRAKKWQRSLNASSYDIYLLHMPLVVFMQAALVPIGMPLFIKMTLAFLIPTAACWGLSRLFHRRPAWTEAGALASFFILFTLTY